MPTLFGSRRHAPPVQPLTWETATPDAASAAASAFKRREPNPAGLSSSAAAAALRALPMAPTNVASVQTKRTQRRSPSVSSLMTRERLPAKDLQRSPSVCSMVERSFRSPSPVARIVPPVSSKTPTVSNVDAIVAERKANGVPLRSQSFLTGSQRIKDGRIGSWFGAATARDPSSVRRSSSVSHSNSSASELRPGSSNRNHSQPRANAESAPDADRKAAANSRRMLPRRNLLTRSQSVRETAEKPRRMKQELSRSGSHASRGTMDRTQAPALQPPPSPPVEQKPVADLDAQSTTSAPEEPRESAKKRKKKKKKAGKRTNQAEGPRAVAADDHAADQDAEASVDKAAPLLSYKLPDVDMGPEIRFQESQVQEPEPKPAATTKDVTRDAGANGPARNSSTAKRRGRGRVARNYSASPARSARFAPPTDEPLVMHEPPARSVSPKKSAMKISPPKDAPLSDDSDMSDRESSPHRQTDDAPKKSARVSWDDNTLVVNEANEPHDALKPTAPMIKKPWHSVVSKNSKEQTGLGKDETMSPRPALPLFGSVREKKSRDFEERQLVRPAGRTRSQSASETGATTDPSQPSDDDAGAAAGAVSAQEQASRNAANISKYREPLPAVTPLAEGGTKGGKLAESSGDELDTDADTEPGYAMNSAPPTHEKPSLSSRDGGPGAEARGDEDVPMLSAGHHDHGAERLGETASELGDTASELGDTASGASELEDSEAADVHPEDVNLAGADDDSESSAADIAERSVEPQTGPGSPLMEDIQEEDDETDRASIYSDACEDLSEYRNGADGFQSLAAVVDGPRDGGMTRESTAGSTNASHDGEQVDEPKNDWENAKMYWKSLSAEQRRQLEVEALAEDHDGGHARSAADGNRRSTKNNGQPLAERSYQIIPGTRWAEGAAAHLPKQAPPTAAATAATAATAAKPTPEAAAARSKSPTTMSSRIQQRLEGPRSAIRSLSEQSMGTRRTMRIGSFEAVWNPKNLEPESTTPTSGAGTGIGKLLRGGGAEAGSPDESGTQSPLAATGPGSQRRNRSVDSPTTQGKASGRLGRRGSEDSLSSFRQPRAASGAPSGFRKSMRRSMQDLRAASSQPAYRRRSLSSAPGSAASLASGGGRMRQSLRGEAPPAPPPRGRGRRRAAFKRSSGPKKGSKAKESRFADSSDEDEAEPSPFRSRFDFSSDEDAAPAPKPKPKSKGMARTLRGDRSSMEAAGSPMTGGASTDRAAHTSAPPGQRHSYHEGAPSPGYNEAGRGAGWSPSAAGSQTGEAARPARRRRGSLVSFFRRMRDGSRLGRDGSQDSAAHGERPATGPGAMRSSSAHQAEPGRRSGSSGSGSGSAGGSARQVLSAARQALSADRGARPSTVSGGIDGAEFLRQRRRKFAALRRMFGIYD